MGQKPLSGQGEFTVFKNYTLDVMMRQLSPNAWKVLCWAIRKTYGWSDPLTDSGRKESDQISYSQFMEGTGIGGRSTLSRALQECMEKDYLQRTQIGTDSRSGRPLYAYGLNIDYTVPSSPETVPPTKPEAKSSSPEMGPLNGPEMGPLSGPKTGLTKQRKQTNKDDDDVWTDEEQRTIQAMTDAGHNNGAARVKEYGASWCGQCLAVATEAGLGAGYLDNLITGKTQLPPAKTDQADTRSRYAGGKYAAYIQT